MTYRLVTTYRNIQAETVEVLILCLIGVENATPEELGNGVAVFLALCDIFFLKTLQTKDVNCEYLVNAKLLNTVTNTDC